MLCARTAHSHDTLLYIIIVFGIGYIMPYSPKYINFAQKFGFYTHFVGKIFGFLPHSSSYQNKGLSVTE